MKVFIFLLSIIIINGCGKKGNDSVSSEPLISINNVQQPRGNSGTTNFQFTVSVDKASTNDIVANYSTTDGTAKAGTDYTATSGTIKIPANQTSATINVSVAGDSLRESNKTFFVQLSNPTNATLGAPQATATIFCDGTYLPVSDSGYVTPLSYPGYTLTWNDEFNEDALDAASWNYETGGSGWGNNELENYTNSIENCFITQHKYLVIEARNEKAGDNNYTSARIQTMGKREFKYGRIDIRARLPYGQGLWPALWMLGSNINTAPWPLCGEIDMVEVLGNNVSKTYGTLHWEDATTGHLQSGSHYTLVGDDFSKEFHVFTTIWTANKIEWYVDDVEYFLADQASITGTDPFNNPFFFIFNVAVGGNWPGSPDGTTVFPQRMIVDYVRVFQ